MASSSPTAVLLSIDNQNDFMDLPDSPLQVPGAVASAKRLAGAIKRNLFKLTVRTHDTHGGMDIAGNKMYVKENGDYIDPFQELTDDDLDSGRVIIRNADAVIPEIGMTVGDWVRKYRSHVYGNTNHTHYIWPDHCIRGSKGHATQEDIQNELVDWEQRNYTTAIDYAKAQSPWVEHYGAIEAVYPLDHDPQTQMRNDLVQLVQHDDHHTFVAGQEGNHCIKATVDQIMKYCGKAHFHKITILTDCINSLPDMTATGGPNFPEMYEKWLKYIEGEGVNLSTIDRSF